MPRYRRVRSERRRWCTLGVAGVLALGSACGDPTSPDPWLRLIPDVRPWVTDAAAAALDDRGRFVFRGPPAGEPAGIDFERAVALAEGFNTTFLVSGGPIARYLEDMRGARIHFAGLAPGDRVYYGRSPYGPVSDTILAYVRRYVGPYIFVHLWNDREPVLSVAVSAFNDHLSVTENGQLDYPRWPTVTGSEFDAQAIKPGSMDWFPVSPERAVRLVADATGERISDVPVLLDPRIRYFKQHARWKLTVERPVEVRADSSGRSLTTNVLYVDLRSRLVVPAPEQPAADTLVFTDPHDGDAPRTLVLEPDDPLVFERVTVDRH